MNKTISSARSHIWLPVAAAVAFLFISSCNKINDNDNSSSSNAAGLMAFHLAAGTGPVLFTLSDNTLTNAPLPYNSFTGTYLGIYPGLRDVKTYISNDSIIASGNFTFEPQAYYSLFLVGTAGNFENIIVKDEIDSLSGDGKAFVRYINAVPGTSDATVTVSGSNGNGINENAPYKNVSSFTAVDAGTVNVNIHDGSTVNVSRSITLEQQKIYTILLSGTPGSSGDNAVQIKYVLNGTTSGNSAKASSAAGRTVE